MNTELPLRERISGCLLGIAVADAIGLPLEGLTRKQIQRVVGNQELQHRFLFGKGMVSDDLEHNCLTGQAILESGGNPELFGKRLAKRLRWWIAGLPAGTGRATMRACIKLWLGKSYERSGVFSAGNGPAMRAPIVGALISDKSLLLQFVTISSQITHSDPKANFGALVVAGLVHEIVHGMGTDAMAPEQVVRIAKEWLPEDKAADELFGLIKLAAENAANGESTREFSTQQNWTLGVSGYTYHTVPAALHACMRYRQDFQSAITELIRCGGDVDSTAAIAGGVIGAAYGESVIPSRWLKDLMEFPRTKRWTRALSKQLSEFKSGQASRPIKINPIVQFARNLLFLSVVVVHVIRRIPLRLFCRG